MFLWYNHTDQEHAALYTYFCRTGSAPFPITTNLTAAPATDPDLFHQTSLETAQHFFPILLQLCHYKENIPLKMKYLGGYDSTFEQLSL